MQVIEALDGRFELSGAVARGLCSPDRAFSRILSCDRVQIKFVATYCHLGRGVFRPSATGFVAARLGDPTIGVVFLNSGQGI
jgi:hypothetical protein